ncbi:ribosomal RNA small subunit methyltransferase A [candidate division WWE3 bacterium CG_4_8_14_3_um_filter_42_11]|uniref:Ribosomal RNA small subunit methyltransferase A n=1 Tax=candidate division WWE3 bacterium CG_4_8_14_3_um_filter_42_11 TaxID=1975076 RepID=A0A2M8G757_UNCKA|nr:MAG: ribosomal RNA small subunit methyltransferase A [candidate division WWE3 bacterium CG_4_8_14_3_um_filter_42_11]
MPFQLSDTKNILVRHGLSPKDRLGQNFLVDAPAAQSIVASAGLHLKDAVVEVGAGLGALTRILAPQVRQVYAVESDSALIPILEENLSGVHNVEILNQNILDFNPQSFNLSRYKIVGSIPYQITSPLIHRVLTLTTSPELATLVVQKEVAEKICAQVPDTNYLATFIISFAQAQIVKILKPASFYPQPKVDSAILKIQYSRKIPKDTDLARWQKFLHHGFMQPRKMLNKRFDKKILEKAGIDPTRRAQTVSLEEWIKLFRSYNQHT